MCHFAISMLLSQHRFEWSYLPMSAVCVWALHGYLPSKPWVREKWSGWNRTNWTGIYGPDNWCVSLFPPLARYVQSVARYFHSFCLSLCVYPHTIKTFLLSHEKRYQAPLNLGLHNCHVCIPEQGSLGTRLPHCCYIVNKSSVLLPVISLVCHTGLLYHLGLLSSVTKSTGGCKTHKLSK